jgi:four helix bundle protein
MPVMGARHFTELIAWQLAHDLQLAVFHATESGPASRDFQFRDQISDSSRSACANIAEGFARVRHREFAQFLRIARGSIAETQSHLLDGRVRSYFTDDRFHKMWWLSVRALAATTRLMQRLAARANAPGSTERRV